MSEDEFLNEWDEEVYDLVIRTDSEKPSEKGKVKRKQKKQRKEKTSEDLNTSIATLKKTIEESRIEEKDQAEQILSKLVNMIMGLGRFTVGRVNLLVENKLYDLVSIALSDIMGSTNVASQIISYYHNLKLGEEALQREAAELRDADYDIYEDQISALDMFRNLVFSYLCPSPGYETTLREWHNKLEEMMKELLAAVVRIREIQAMQDQRRGFEMSRQQKVVLNEREVR
ncbi:MAG: hypothetical protein ACQXXE_08665 [Candidatus Bathyarchaeia archaeon]